MLQVFSLCPGQHVTRLHQARCSYQTVEIRIEDLGELWSQFNFLMPGMLADYKTFTKNFRTPIEKNDDLQRRKLLSKWIRPLILRRTKAQAHKNAASRFAHARSSSISFLSPLKSRRIHFFRQPSPHYQSICNAYTGQFSKQLNQN